MGSEVDCNLKGELDDSGCVQDDTTQISELSLMDMPDDVLLHILKWCPAPERKALAYCCARLCRMVQERMLWRYVDARTERCSRARLRWYLDNTLQDDTQMLLLTGFAKDMDGCLGFMNVTREEGEKAKGSDSNWDTVEDLAQQLPAEGSVAQQRKIFAPRCSGMPTWGDNELGRGGEEACIGPQFSLSQELLRQLAATCPQLSTLALEFCNIDCRDTNLGDFPKTLKRLSLRGSRCYNMVMDKTFLFRINFFLPHLQSLDVSECEWLDPATLLPLSKLTDLTELQMRDCSKLTEFVAYASLTARYGFKALKSLDLRGSPVGDSEISALGWLPSLERLWLARTHAPRTPRRLAAHAHYLDDPAVMHVQLHPWEEMEPHMLRVRPNPTYYYYDDIAMEFSEREREGLKRKPEETENQEIKRSPKRIREDGYYIGRDDLMHQRCRFFMNIKTNSRTNNLKRKLLDQNNVNVNASTSKDNDAVNENNRADDNVNESNENDAKKKDPDEGKSKNVSQNVRSSKSDDNQDDDDDYFAEDQNPIRANGEPGKTLIIEINLKDGTQTRSYVDLRGPGRSVDNLLSNEFRGIPNVVEENAGTSNAGNENAEIQNMMDENAGVPNVVDENIEIPNAGNGKPEIPNGVDKNIENPNVVDDNAGIPKVVDENVEIPNTGNENAELQNMVDDNSGNGKAEIPSVKNEKAEIPNLDNENVEIPDEGNENVEIPHVGNENAEIPYVGNENVEIPHVGNENAEIPYVGNENVEIPNVGNENAEIPNVENGNANGNDNGENQDQPNENRDGAQPNPGQNRDLMDCLKIDGILNFGEVRCDDHGEVIVFASAKRAKMQPTQTVGPQPNGGPVASGFGHDRLMIINCSWEQAKRRRRQAMTRLMAEAQAQGQAPMQGQAQAPGQAQEQGQAQAPGQAQAQGQVQTQDQAQVNEGASTSRDNPSPRVEDPVDYRIEPRHHVLYVNVGRHTSTYRFPRDFVAPEFPGIRGLNVQRQHVDSSALVTDFAIRRFGRADGEDVNIIHLGPNGPVVVGGQDPGARPDRSTLRFLSVNGYRNITDRSLMHLATAAPNLEHVDFSDTSVSDAGAESFRNLRPDCELIYSKFTEKED